MTATTLKEQAMNSATRLASKRISLSRDMTAVSADVAYTGVGFTPTSIMFIGTVSSVCYSSGMCDSAKAQDCIFHAASAAYTQGDNSLNNCLLFVTAGNQYHTALVKTFDADGFTLTWSKVNSPTGTAKVVALCFR
mgnify:CR=1 FL=1